MRAYWLNSVARWADLIDLNARVHPGAVAEALAHLDDALREAIQWNHLQRS